MRGKCWINEWQVCVVDRQGRVGWGSSARFELSPKLVGMLKEGKELAEVIDAISGKADVRSREGAMGVLTNGHLTVQRSLPPSCRVRALFTQRLIGLYGACVLVLEQRAEAYSHGVWFAFAPFVSPREYWA